MLNWIFWIFYFFWADDSSFSEKGGREGRRNSRKALLIFGKRMGEESREEKGGGRERHKTNRKISCSCLKQVSLLLDIKELARDSRALSMSGSIVTKQP